MRTKRYGNVNLPIKRKRPLTRAERKVVGVLQFALRAGVRITFAIDPSPLFEQHAQHAPSPGDLAPERSGLEHTSSPVPPPLPRSGWDAQWKQLMPGVPFPEGWEKWSREKKEDELFRLEMLLKGKA